MAVASWASSGVVQGIKDYWKYDEQVYTSTMKSGGSCTATIAAMQAYVTAQAALRLDGQDNAIDTVLKGTEAENMLTDDFMAFIADIAAGKVQYGERVAMCTAYEAYAGQKPSAVFPTLVSDQVAAGNDPYGYDTRRGTPITTNVIDVNNAGRPWTYQYCTQFGWYQTVSKEHAMRSALLTVHYNNALCERVFEGLDMTNLPNILGVTIEQGGFNIAGTNTFFANGSEDPWQWATQRTNRVSLNQVARTSDCDVCGHCCELYTPKDSDPASLQQTRVMVADWITDIIGTNTTAAI